MTEKKLIIWGIVLIALTAYAMLVYSWWMEGTYRFDQQRADQEIQYLQ